MRPLDADKGSEVGLFDAGRGEVGSDVHGLAMFAYGKHLGKTGVCGQKVDSGREVWHAANMRLVLRKIRKSRGLTIDQVAEMSGLSRGFISQLETGKREPSSDTLEILAAAFRLRVVDLIDAGDERGELIRLADMLPKMKPEDRENLVLMAEALAAKNRQ